MNTQVICLVVLLIAGFSQAQFPPIFNQLNPFAENSHEPKVRNVDSNSAENPNYNNGTNDQNRPDNNQQESGRQQPNVGEKATNAAKEMFQEKNDALKNAMNSIMNVGKAHVNAAKDLTETGIKFGSTFPQFGAKLMGQSSDGDSQKNGPFGGFGFFN